MGLRDQRFAKRGKGREKGEGLSGGYSREDAFRRNNS